MAQQTVSPFASKTNLLGVIQVVLGILSAVAGSTMIKDHPELMSWLVVANGVLTIILRQLTTKPITKWTGKGA